jgi:hypothetical protein
VGLPAEWGYWAAWVAVFHKGSVAKGIFTLGSTMYRIGMKNQFQLEQNHPPSIWDSNDVEI